MKRFEITRSVKTKAMLWKRLLVLLLLVVILPSPIAAPEAMKEVYAERADVEQEEAVAGVAVAGAEGSEIEEAQEAEQVDEIVEKQNEEVEKDSTEPAQALTPVTATKEVLRNEHFTLYLDEATGNVRLVSNQSGTEWLGSPQVPTTLPPNNKKFIDSPILLRFTEGSDITTTYSLKDSTTKMDIQVEGDRVVLSYNFEAEGISLQMIYRLTERGLQLDIPFSSIVESKLARLTSIEPLPFFNGALETDEGAQLIPDGSGALLQFRTQHEQYLKGYSEYIYGNDSTFVSHTNDLLTGKYKRGNTNRESIALPVFGIYRNGVGSLAIVESGQYEAKINVSPAGIRAIPVYRSAVEFMYRKNDVIFIGSSGQIPYFQGQMLEGDRTVSYVLLEGEEANYVGLAKAYRSYLMEEQGVKPVADQAPRLSLKLFGGILREEIIGNTFIEMTTFRQAEEILSKLRSQGLDQLLVTYDGWTKDGVYGAQPQHQAAKQLGGKKGLTSLSQYTKEHQIPLYLRANYVKPFEQEGKYSQRKEAVRGMDREILVDQLYSPSGRWGRSSFSFHYLKPELAFKNYVEKQSKELTAYGIDGLQLQYMGQYIYSDEDKATLTDRSVAAEAWKKSMAHVKETIGSTAVEYGNAYALGLIDRIEEAPLGHSYYTYTDIAVPFYQLVMHGLVPYYASPINLREDAEMERLRAIEYGALPSAELTGELSSKLHRTAETRLFSSYAEDWIEPISSEYQELQPLYEAIAGEAMVNHEQVMPSVYRTSYSNGVAVIVNYSSAAVSIDGSTVDGMNYTWSRR